MKLTDYTGEVTGLSVLDLGCGDDTTPLGHQVAQLRCASLLQVDIFNERPVTSLAARHLKIKANAVALLRALADKSFDIVLMLDFIEHLPKELGKQVLLEAERVARKRVVLWLPIGTCPQSGDANPYQEHVSTWELADFEDGWNVTYKPNFHTQFNPPVSAAWVVSKC